MTDERDIATDTAGLDETGRKVQSRREQLHEATIDLSDALESPIEPPQQWLDAIRASIARTRTLLETHVREAEAPDGLLAQVIEEEPAFGSRVQQMRAEHVELLNDSATLLQLAEEDASVDELRAKTTELVDLIEQHRHRSGSLLIDAYSLDLSAGD